MNPGERAPLKLLIRGFGVRVPGGAPVLTWAIFQIREVDLRSGLHLGLQLAELEKRNLHL